MSTSWENVYDSFREEIKEGMSVVVGVGVVWLAILMPIVVLLAIIIFAFATADVPPKVDGTARDEVLVIIYRDGVPIKLTKEEVEMIGKEMAK